MDSQRLKNHSLRLITIIKARNIFPLFAGRYFGLIKGAGQLRVQLLFFSMNYGKVIEFLI